MIKTFFSFFHRKIQTLLVILFLAITLPMSVKAQALKVLVSDTFIGTFNGALLGAGTMALANNTNVTPVRFGVGFGTLYGLGVGIIDISQMQQNQPYSVSGTINTVGNSAGIVLMDTFYGGVAGGVVGCAISLITNQRVVKGLQYGAGAGVWAGAAFGLMDAFYFSKGHPLFNKYPRQETSEYSGLINLKTTENSSISFLNPATVVMPKATSEGISLHHSLALEVAHYQIRF